MAVEEIPVRSGKYSVSGKILDYNVSTILLFKYEGKQVVMGIKHNPIRRESLSERGEALIDFYIDHLHVSNRPLELHNWYISEREVDGEVKRFGNGIVTGHDKIPDSCRMETEEIKDIEINENRGEILLIAKEHTYACELSSCRFRKQDKYPDVIPYYPELKEKYKYSRVWPSIEPGKILLVLSDTCEFYFHSVYYVLKDEENMEPLDYTGWPHIGSFQDSYLIDIEEAGIDLRYFPHFRNIEFYEEDTRGLPLFIENIGGSPLYARTSCGWIRLEPGERKEVKEENAEKEKPVLPNGDLYPA